SKVLAVWNDGETLAAPGPIGFGYSLDGGVTWRDGGTPAVGGRVAAWVSDPVVTVDGRTGDFYLAALAIVTRPLANAIAVIKGTFRDTGFAWQTPVVARTTRDTFPDKPWLAADSLSGRLYLSYTTFIGSGSG